MSPACPFQDWDILEKRSWWGRCWSKGSATSWISSWDGGGIEMHRNSRVLLTSPHRMLMLFSRFVISERLWRAAEVGSSTNRARRKPYDISTSPISHKLNLWKTICSLFFLFRCVCMGGGGGWGVFDDSTWLLEPRAGLIGQQYGLIAASTTQP